MATQQELYRSRAARDRLREELEESQNPYRSRQILRELNAMEMRIRNMETQLEPPSIGVTPSPRIIPTTPEVPFIPPPYAEILPIGEPGPMLTDPIREPGPTSPILPTLPENPTWADIIAYEEKMRKLNLAKTEKRLEDLRKGTVSLYDEYSNKYATETAKRRAALASQLPETARQQFALNNPYLLEDLNRRGLFTSSSEVARAEAQAQKELALQTAGQLTDFDVRSGMYADELAKQRLSALSQIDAAKATAGIGGENDALNSALDLRRAQLETGLQSTQAQQEQAFAEDLARRARKQQIAEALIGAGGNLGSAYLMSSMMGGGGGDGGGGVLSSLNPFSKASLASGAGSRGVAYAGAGNPSSTLFPGGLGAVGTSAPVLFGSGGALFNTAGTSTLGMGNVLPGLAGYYAGTRVFRPTQPGEQAAMNVGGAIGALGGSAFGPLGSAAGGFLGTAVGKAESRLQKGIEKSLGGTAGSIARYALPMTSISSIGKKIAKRCFGEETEINLIDGTKMMISDINLDDKTEGGIVESVRISKTANGTRYNYDGVEVTGSHAVLEDGKWIRIKESEKAYPIDGEGIVYSIVTSDHRINVGDKIFADEVETDDYEDLTINQSLDRLNELEKVT